MTARKFLAIWNSDPNGALRTRIARSQATLSLGEFRGQAAAAIPREDVRIRAEIVCCRLCGEGWYMSGAKFVEFLG